MIPMSTALYDPKWYDTHGMIARDKNGVILGLNDKRFHPDVDSECPRCIDHDPTKCSFINNYYNKISKLNFEEVIKSYEELGRALGIVDPILVLIVHEAPSNPCSERSALIKLFKEHNIDLEEFNAKKEET